MVRVLKRLMGCLTLCLLPLVCASCLSMAVPQRTKVERPEAEASASKDLAERNPLTDVWELLYQVDKSGKEEKPSESTRTLIEFTPRGRVFFNKLDKKTQDSIKSRAGHYKIKNEELTIIDDVGYTATWPYKLTGDTLVIVIPEIERKFYWRRHR